MCVILACEAKRPTEEMVEKAWNCNKDGAGIAWREGKGKTGEVVWEKNLNLEEIQQHAATAPFPFVAHFRIASIGGVRGSLCHPFEIDKLSLPKLKGRTSGAVLFHNGTWYKWKEAVLNCAEKFGSPLPDGKWSDTKALAWLCAHYGKNYMEFVEEKGIYFSPTALDVFWGSGGWTDIDGVLCSNQSFNYSTCHRGGGMGMGVDWRQTTSRTMCKAPVCAREDHLDDDGYCPLHTLRPLPPVEIRGNQNEVRGNEVRVKVAPDDTADQGHSQGQGLLRARDARAAGGGPKMNPFVSVLMAQDLFKKGKISKNKLKKIQKAYEMLTGVMAQAVSEREASVRT